MHPQKRAAFSPDNKFFACISTDEKLLIWETSNNVFIDCNFDSSVYNTCSSMHWISAQSKSISPKKAKLSKNCPIQSYLLAVGTIKGDILIYNVANRNLYLHLVGRHSDAVNDMCFYTKTNLFFTCSNDKCIGIWDIASGKQISKWEADDNPVSSICVIDHKSMLSSSTSILWWNILEKSVLRKFDGHSAEVFKLIAVNAYSMNSCYFLSAAVSDLKINAWSINSFVSETPVASFVLPEQPEDVDISNVSSKDKPLILSAVTKDGFLHLFEHSLNGNVSQPITPKVSVAINSESEDISFSSVKLSHDKESCIIAYGSSKSKVSFKHIKIKELFIKSELENSKKSKSSSKLSLVNDANIVGKSLSVNGIKTDYKKKLRSSTISSSAVEDTLNPNEADTTYIRNIKCEKDIDLKDSENFVECFLEALEMHNDSVIEAVLRNSDQEFINATVKKLPTSSLSSLIGELNRRLHQKYSPVLSKWLKEIFRCHLKYILQSQDTLEALTEIKKYLASKNIHQTQQKMMVVQGFLNLQTQSSSDNESDSGTEGPMEL